MTLRKYYIKARVYLYSIRHITNAIFIVFMSLALFSFFINYFLFGRIINNLANNDELSGKFSSAISLYKVEYGYYSIFHFTLENKERYFELPYKIAKCYLASGDKSKSVASMLSGLKTIQKQYGIISRETAYFIRKYLIEYYLDNNKHGLASKEFQNLLTIYKKIGYNGNEMADMIRLSGDLYYAQKQYDIAMGFYKKSYDAISGQSAIDYDTYVKIVNRMAKYEILEKNPELAEELYKKTINQLKVSGKKQDKLRATMLISLGELYEDLNKTKPAISSYEEAVEIIKKLPATNYLRQNITKYLLKLQELYNKDSQFHKANEVKLEITKAKRFSFF